MGIHDEHRKRLRQRFLKEGLDNFNEINALELLLFYSIPRKDTNPIAHALLDMFGSVSQVLEAPPEALMRVNGVSTETATYLNLLGQTCRYYLVNRNRAGDIFNTVDSCIAFFLPRFLGRPREMVQIMCLDSRCKLLKCAILGEGTVGAAEITMRSIAEVALGCHATSVVLAHNHPNGFALPSHEDINMTLELREFLSKMGIVLADHLVISDLDCVSMAQSGIFDKKNK